MILALRKGALDDRDDGHCSVRYYVGMQPLCEVPGLARHIDGLVKGSYTEYHGHGVVVFHAADLQRKKQYDCLLHY